MKTILYCTKCKRNTAQIEVNRRHVSSTQTTVTYKCDSCNGLTTVPAIRKKVTA